MLSPCPGVPQAPPGCTAPSTSTARRASGDSDPMVHCQWGTKNGNSSARWTVDHRVSVPVCDSKALPVCACMWVQQKGHGRAQVPVCVCAWVTVSPTTTTRVSQRAWLFHSSSDDRGHGHTVCVWLLRGVLLAAALLSHGTGIVSSVVYAANGPPYVHAQGLHCASAVPHKGHKFPQPTPTHTVTHTSPPLGLSRTRCVVFCFIPCWCVHTPHVADTRGEGREQGIPATLY